MSPREVKGRQARDWLDPSSWWKQPGAQRGRQAWRKLKGAIRFGDFMATWARMIDFAAWAITGLLGRHQSPDCQRPTLSSGVTVQDGGGNVASSLSDSAFSITGP